MNSRIVNRFTPILAFLIIILFNGCGMQEMMNKTNKIHDVALSNCSCDDVRLMNYTEQNFRTYAYIEVVGMNGFSKKEIANKINEALKREVTDYCKIDEFTMDFINKGNHETVIVRYCKIEE